MPRKLLTIQVMNKIAKQRGGECLSDDYVNSQAKLKWRCNEGHEWEATPNNIKKGTWCPVCRYNERGKKRRLTIENMMSIASERGGKVLSKDYITSYTKLKWHGAEGHIWEATPNNIRSGRWCPFCSRKRK